MNNLLTKILFISLLLSAVIPSGVQATSYAAKGKKFAKKAAAATVGILVGGIAGEIVEGQIGKIAKRLLGEKRVSRETKEFIKNRVGVGAGAVIGMEMLKAKGEGGIISGIIGGTLGLILGGMVAASDRREDSDDPGLGKGISILAILSIAAAAGSTIAEKTEEEYCQWKNSDSR